MKFATRFADCRVTKLSVAAAEQSAAGLTAGQASRALLEHWVRAPTTPQRVVLRSRIVLSALAGHSADETASQVDVSPTTVRLWTARFEHGGPEALLHDAPGRGRHAIFTADAMRDRLREANLVRPDGLPVSIRRAAKFLGVSASAVWRALRKNRNAG